MPEDPNHPVHLLSAPAPPNPLPSPTNHFQYMLLALDQAYESPPKPTNYRVGALLVNSLTGAILARGYTLECEGNTHAEQCCLMKYAAERGVEEKRVGEVLPGGTVLYTTMEPCVRRLSGNISCVERILRTRGSGPSGGRGIEKVYVGVREPEKFVGENEGRARLEEEGIEVVHVPGLEERILSVATAGHVS